MYRYLLALTGLLGVGAQAAPQAKACLEIQQNLKDVLAMQPVSAPQHAQQSLSVGIGLKGLWTHCAGAEARKFVKARLLPAEYWNDEIPRCEKLEDRIEALLTDSRADSSPRVNQLMSEALVKLELYEKYCGPAGKGLYRVSLCHAGGACR